MKKINHLVNKGKKIICWNKIGIGLFVLGLISLGLTVVLTTTTKHPFYIYSLILMLPMIIVAAIYDNTVKQILDEILNVFEERLKWGINNDDIYSSTHSHIKEVSVSEYTIIIECNSENISEISSLTKEIINGINSDLPPKFQLKAGILVKV